MKHNARSLLLVGTLLSQSLSNAMYVVSKSSDTFLTIIQQYLPAKPIIVEAGAFKGADSKRLGKHLQGTVYVFEPDPINFVELKKTIRGCSKIYAWPYALSDANGYAPFYQSQDPNDSTNTDSGSLFRPKEHLRYSSVQFPSTVQVRTITLDAWAKQQSIDHIDFLWLSTQGTELHILKASPDILKTVRVIYTKVEYVEAYEGQHQYNDLKQWLEQQGFVLIAQNCREGDGKNWYGDMLMVRKELITCSTERVC